VQSRSQSGSKRGRLEEARARLAKLFAGAPAQQAAAAELSAEERLRAAWDLALAIGEFAQTYLPHYLVDQETGQPIEPAEFHRELYQLVLTEQRLAVAAPREHAKSTILFIFVTYCVCYKLRRFVVYISDTEAQAILQLNAVKSELETNDKLRQDFGDLVDDRKWGERDIETSTGIRLSARGAGQSLRGLRKRQFRPDLVICDDLEEDEAVDSPERREKLERWFKRTVMNLGKNCQIIVVGTILHYDSLLAHLTSEEHFPTFVKRFYVAVDDDWSLESVLWPGKWSLEALKAKAADIGLVDFDQEFRNRPINAATQVFREDWVKQHAFTWDEIRGMAMMKIMAVDPAISVKQKADFFGRVLIGIVGTGHILVLRGEQHKIPFTEQVKLLLAKYDAEQPEWIGIESVAYQKALKQRMDEVSRETGRYIAIVEVDTKGIDKFARISTMGPLVENGTIRFCLDGTQDTLLKQLYFLGKMKDDVADALEIAVRVAREKRFSKPALASEEAPPGTYGPERRGLLRGRAA